MKNSTITTIISLPLIFLFLYTAASKLLNFQLMVDRLRIYPFISSFASAIAPGIIICELIITVMLFLPKTRAAGFISAAVLLAIFTVYLALMVSTQQELPCTCGGVIEKITWKQHIPFNLVFIVLSVAGVLLERRAGNYYSASLRRTRHSI